jgi:PST family polysaccharide transporter
MTLRSQALTGLVWSAVEKWGGKAANLIVFVVLARILDPDAFGLVALATVFVALMNVFVDQGFADALVQREDLDDVHLDTAFWTNVGLSVVMTGLVIVLAGPVAHLLGEPNLEPVLRWLSAVIVLRSFCGVQDAIFRRNLDFRILSVRSLVSMLVGGTVGVGMAFAGYGVWSLVGQQITQMMMQVLVLWTASDWVPRRCFSRSHFTDLFSFGVSILGSNLLNFLNRRSDDLLIGAFLGSTALGYYSVAYKILYTVTDLIASVGSRVALPAFSRLQHDKKRTLKAFYTTTEVAGLISFPVFGGIVATASLIIPLFFGEQWAASVPVMQILSFIGILHGLFYFNTSVIVANGKASWRLGISILNAIGNVIAFSIAVHFGIQAVAFAYVARGYLFAPVPLWVLKKLIDLDYATYLYRLLVPASATALMGGLVFGLKLILQDTLPPWALLALLVLVGAILYVATVYVLAADTVQRIWGMVQEVRDDEEVEEKT